MEQIETQKFKMEQETKEDLKIYFFIVRSQEIKIQGEAVAGILAYSLEPAIIKAQVENQGKSIVYHGQFATIKDLINKIYLEQTQVIPPPIEVMEKIPEISKEQMGLETFKTSLILASKELIKDEEDKKLLEKILKKLKVEDKTNNST